MAQTSGCALSGFVLVKKVPGTLHFLAKSPGHSFDHLTMNMSHVVNYFFVGNKPSPRRRKVMLSALLAQHTNGCAAKLDFSSQAPAQMRLCFMAAGSGAASSAGAQG